MKNPSTHKTRNNCRPPRKNDYRLTRKNEKSRVLLPFKLIVKLKTIVNKAETIAKKAIPFLTILHLVMPSSINIEVELEKSIKVEIQQKPSILMKITSLIFGEGDNEERLNNIESG